MADEPIPLELRLGLRAGSIYYFQSRTDFGRAAFLRGDQSQTPGRKLLLLTIVTSKVDKVRIRNRERPNTVVEISPEEMTSSKCCQRWIAMSCWKSHFRIWWDW